MLEEIRFSCEDLKKYRVTPRYIGGEVNLDQGLVRYRNFGEEVEIDCPESFLDDLQPGDWWEGWLSVCLVYRQTPCGTEGFVLGVKWPEGPRMSDEDLFGRLSALTGYPVENS